VPSYLPASNDILRDADNFVQLADMDVIVTCHGSEYTKSKYEALRKSGWTGYWIDAASILRTQDDSVLALDPINSTFIEQSIETGSKTFVGANCTVSLLLMALNGLLRRELVEWINVATYQAVSGAGAEAIGTLISENSKLAQAWKNCGSDIQSLTSNMLSSFVAPPLACNLLPWIGEDSHTEQSGEESKMMFEANKILQRSAKPIPIHSIAVRVPALRCHSQAVLLKLNTEMGLTEIKQLIEKSTPWTKLVENNKSASLTELTPISAAGKLDIKVGRLFHPAYGKEYLSLFTVGDQLLWGAAEPLRRVLRMIVKSKPSI
jgi:aspartate-semialdehyde dehydrogenase